MRVPHAASHMTVVKSVSKILSQASWSSIILRGNRGCGMRARNCDHPIASVPASMTWQVDVRPNAEVAVRILASSSANAIDINGTRELGIVFIPNGMRSLQITSCEF